MIFLIDFINSCVSNLNVLLYFNLLSKRKENLSSAWMAAIYIVVTLINTMLLNQFKSSIVITISCIVFLFIFAYCYQFKWYTRILFVFLLLIILICSELFTGLIASYCFSVPISTIQNVVQYYSMASLLLNSIVFYCLFYIDYIKNQNRIRIQKKMFFYLAIFPFASILVSYSFFMMLPFNDTSWSAMFYLLSILMLLASNIAVFHIITQMAEAQMQVERMRFLEEQLTLQKKHYDDIRMVQKHTRKLWHDMKGRLTHLYGLLNQNDLNGAKQHISKLIGKVYSLSAASGIYTGCDGLDAVISEKVLEAESLAIKIDLGIFLPDQLNIDEMDLSLIANNILDNAIHATAYVSDRSKSILFKIQYDAPMLHIISSNPTINSKIEMPRHTITSMHGFGLENIDDLCKKWNGNLYYAIIGQQFEIMISLLNG
ncbi:sensor histidine kinase [Eubacterium callanderi]|jgi:signal transduction histidine kinase|nr:GHKL domain-containing protein [Eubacterium callanderi]MCC3402617.1 GHKL domain-containing protein [Eubacterium callanderi]